jgi:hypothetical protein
MSDQTIEETRPEFKPLDNEPTQRTGEKDIDHSRRLLRARYITSSLIGRDVELTHTADFDGGGDSGDLQYDGPDDMEKFFDQILDEHVTFDWYNGDGGGGDIHWDMSTDIITISGFSRYTETESKMSEETF